MQEVKKVDSVIQDAMRIGNKVIVGFPNSPNIKSRLIAVFPGKVTHYGIVALSLV